MSRRNGTAAARLRPGVACRFSFWLFPLFARPLGLYSRLSGRRRVTLTWRPWSRTPALVRTILLAGCYHTQKSESNAGLAHPYLSAQPSTPLGTKCHPGGGPAPGGGPEGRAGATITWAGMGGFDGWAASQKKDAATPAPPINTPTTKFQIILSLCHAFFIPMSHLVF
ncbi:MAG: hypothetical protein ACR2KT_16645 [Methylocella sp.]|nr:MAG: hypothetical protein DLM68_11390 [Hyphomicrobiales bacterium]